MDHPCLADCVAFDRSDHKTPGLAYPQGNSRQANYSPLTIFYSLLAYLRLLPHPDGDLHCPDVRQVLYLALAWAVHFAGAHANRSSLCCAHIFRGCRARLLPRIVGHHTRVLDVLHLPDAATLRGAGTRDGGGRFLAGGTDAENGLGETRLLEASTACG